MPKDKRYGVNGRSRGLIPIPDEAVPVGERCVTILIPDSDAAERQLVGMLYELTHWQNFDREATHKGTQWARAWRKAIVDSVPLGGCGGLQTLIVYDADCGLRWSYDGGSTWTSISMASCADAEILSKISFQVSAGKLRVSLNGGSEWATIYDAPALADTEILNMIDFQTSGTALRVSLNGGSEWATIYDAKPIADAEILAQVDFLQQGNVLKATLNGGTEWGVIYDPGTQANPQPEPNPGDCRVYKATFAANNLWICPSPINDGSTVALSNISGAWGDGSGAWWCGDGSSYGFGICNPDGQTHDVGDPLASAFHMAIIGSWGTTYFDPLTDVYTLPVGSGSQNFVLMANDGSRSDNYGEISCDVTVCTPASGWTHVFDFTVDNGAWTAISGLGTYVAASGWHSVASGGIQVIYIDSPAFASSQITHLLAEVYTENPGTNDLLAFWSGTGGEHRITPIENIPSQTWTTFQYDVDLTLNDIRLNTSGPGYLCKVRKITVSGPGTDPF